MTRLNQIFYEPINTITHLIGALGALVGLIILLNRARGMPAMVITFSIYGLAQLLLYLASCLLHGVKASHRWHFFLNRIDHMAIFSMIAGVYTPILYHLLPDPWRWYLLVFVWLFAFIGMGFKLLNRHIHGFYNASIYLLMSWGTAVPIIIFFDVNTLFSQQGLWLVLGGGIIYSLGFVIYFFEKPDPFPGILGHHEIWHLFVMGGSFLHFLFILTEVAPS